MTMPALTIPQALALALQHHQAGRLQPAEQLYRQILAQQPQHAEALHLLGVIANQTGHSGEAVNLIGQAIALNPRFPAALNNLGIALQDLGRVDEAIAAHRQALALDPNDAATYSNLGNALQDNGQLDEALAAFRQAIALNPNHAKAYSNLGNVLEAKGQLPEAIAACRQALALDPNLFEANANLGNALMEDGQLDAALIACRKALALRPNHAGIHSNLVFRMHYHPAMDAPTLAAEHRRWNHQHAQPLQPFIPPHRNDRSPDRRLRIGYVSPDFREHPVGRFLLPLLAHHDHNNFEIFAYAQLPASDAMTAQLRSHTDHWHGLARVSDPQAAELIGAHQIDILIDLAGHTANSRLLVFARKPAPVQVTYLGYPDTTGLATMDYRLTDAWADPPGQTESYHSEALVRLDPCAWCYQPRASPPVTPRPDGPITFGSFNTFVKVTAPMLHLWSRILKAVPDSRLLLKALALGSESTRQRVRGLLGQEGIGPERLELRGGEPHYADHLALYHRIDVALDTFPYHGTTTTCEALWMGVPVVTLAGSCHVSRVGVSLLTTAGLPELVATTTEEYLQIAASLAHDRPRLTHLRATLRPQLQQSPLMDAPRFARTIEAAYRQMWRQWCAASHP